VGPCAAISHSGSRHLVWSGLIAADPSDGHSGPSDRTPIAMAEAYVERLIGSIRSECLDHMIVFGEAHLRRILRGYAAYYNEARTHRSLKKDAPFHRAIQHVGAITSQPVLRRPSPSILQNLNFSAHAGCALS
jgi:Integrase core domain